MSLFKRRSNDPDALVNNAMQRYEAGDIDEALKVLDRALELDDTHAQGWYCKGCLLADLDRLDEAIECYRRSAATAGEMAYLPVYNMGNALQALGRVDEALECFTRATELSPDDADAWINRGRLLDDAGDSREALRCYDTALGLEPDDVMAWTNRGNSCRSLREFAEARRSYEEALTREPQHAPALVGLAACLAELGDADAGLRVISQVINVDDPLRPVALVEQSVILAKLNRDDEALAALNAAADQGHVSPQACNNRAELLARLGRPDEALSAFEEALDLDPDFAPAHFGKARLLTNLGRLDDAQIAVANYFRLTTPDDELRDAAHAILTLCRPDNAPDSDQD